MLTVEEIQRENFSKSSTSVPPKIKRKGLVMEFGVSENEPWVKVIFTSETSRKRRVSLLLEIHRQIADYIEWLPHDSEKCDVALGATVYPPGPCGCPKCHNVKIDMDFMRGVAEIREVIRKKLDPTQLVFASGVMSVGKAIYPMPVGWVDEMHEHR